MLEINAFLKDNFIVVNAEKKERKVINMTREKVIKVIESTFLDENIDKELYILYGTVLGGACGIIIKENNDQLIVDNKQITWCAEPIGPQVLMNF